MYKYSLRFWVDRYTLDFESIQTEYDCRVLRHIHMVAVEQDLPTGSREKNELGGFELGLMYMEAMALQEGVLQTKQHYLAWVLAYITGARPGTFTVGTGYHKGAPLGGAMSHTMPTRAVSHTLRWADIKFEKLEQEYCCILTFCFLKGSHDKYKEDNLDGSREFFFAPKQERLHLDLSALLFGEGKAWMFGTQTHTLTSHSLYPRLVCRPVGRSPQRHVPSFHHDQIGSGNTGCVPCGEHRM